MSFDDRISASHETLSQTYSEQDFDVDFELDIFFEKVTASYRCRCEVYGSGWVDLKRAVLFYDNGEVELSDSLFNRIKEQLKEKIEEKYSGRIEVIANNILYGE